MPDIREAAEQLRTALVGSFYARFSVHTGFDLEFEDFVLAAQEVESADEDIVNRAFVSNYLPARSTATPEVIGKSAVLAACLGSTVSEVEVAPDASLTLGFDNGVRLRLPTTTPVVDWHWAITEGHQDPYSGCLIACFAAGEIQGCIANNSSKPKPLRGSA